MIDPTPAAARRHERPERSPAPSSAASDTGAAAAARMPVRRGRATIAMLLAVLMAACTTTPTAPPVLDVPPGNAAADAVALDRWWTQFGDATLTGYVDEALLHNLDLAAAMARIETARAQVKLAQSDLYPSVNLGVDASRNRSTEVGSNPLPPGFSSKSSDFRVALDASYELDLWGKYRTATRAAREELLATRYARETVQTSVAAEVARVYFQLLAADAQLALLDDTLKSRDQTVALQRDRYQGGVIGEYDLAQAEAERAAVVADIATTRRAAGQLESALAVLLGRSPREVFAPAVARDAKAAQLVAVPAIPGDLPSNLLARRPDIQQAERSLAAASLRIDVARADYFPSLSLTGSLGTESGALKNLFSGPALIWGVGASLLQPLFGLKAIEANVEAAAARREEAVVGYRQVVQGAFRDTHDALVANGSARDALAAQSLRRERLARALELADIRYKAGYSPYLEVLDAQRQLLQAQTLEIAAARDARIASVDLAKALGGGWDFRADLAAR
jgi:multidrug efflux system outer membrane protein